MTGKVVHLDPQKVADVTCPHCNKNNYKRLVLVHLLKKVEEDSDAYQFNCDYAKQEYQKMAGRQRVGNPVIGSFNPRRECTCYECLINDGYPFNEETNEFSFVADKTLIGD